MIRFCTKIADHIHVLCAKINLHANNLIDRYDLALLDALQRQGDATNAQLGEAVHLSPSQISRRLARLADVGIIAGHAALLDAAAIGLSVTAFAQVILERHGTTQSDAFENAAAAIPG